MLYSFVLVIGRIMFKLLGLRVEGLENLPPSGPVIVAANHVSNWDPVVVGLALNRRVHFMSKVQLFKYWPLRRLLRRLHAFPVRQDIPDRKAIHHSLQVLAAGQVLGIFPEGRRNRSGEMLAQPGVVYIALRSGSPVVPVACLGTRRSIPWGWSQPLLVRIGEPYCMAAFPTRKLSTEDMEKLGLELMGKIQALMNT